MAEFVTVMKEFHRLCETEECDDCVFGRIARELSKTCYGVVTENPERAEETIMKWAAEHPRKTLRDRFFEMFPNAPKNGGGNPRICPSELGLTDPEYCDYNCEKCWSAEWKGDNKDD